MPWIRTRRYPPEVLERISELAAADPAREVCGFVVAQPGKGLQVVPVPNAADRFHAEDPEQFPGTAHGSYLMDPLAQYRVLAELAASGGWVAAVYHSHVEAGAYFSARDRQGAVWEGTPQLPGAEYLVVSLRGGVCGELKRFVWDGQNFTEKQLWQSVTRRGMTRRNRPDRPA